MCAFIHRMKRALAILARTIMRSILIAFVLMMKCVEIQDARWLCHLSFGAGHMRIMHGALLRGQDICSQTFVGLFVHVA